ncbi:MAG: hypothetical protein AAF721_26490 [Myxococcota bacterium]
MVWNRAWAAIALGLSAACSNSAAPPASCWDTTEGELGFGTLNEAQVDAMRNVENDGPFHMLNLIRFREQACYRDGRATELSGREADALYDPAPFLDGIGANVVFAADARETLLGDGMAWDRVAVVDYPSRAKFFEMTDDPAFRETAEHKEAGVEQTLVIVSDLRDSALPPGFQPAASPFPATDEDPTIDVVHLMAFRELAEYPAGDDEPSRTGEEAVALYEEAAAPAALELGVYPVAWFDIEGVYVGDGRTWDQLRINRMPSGAAFQALRDDPVRLAGERHREAGLADTYSVVVQPLFDTLDPIEDSDGDAPPVGADGTGTPCGANDDCVAFEASHCLIAAGDSGICTIQGCAAGQCTEGYACCSDCNPAVAAALPFEGSACLPSAQVTAVESMAGCRCE